MLLHQLKFPLLFILSATLLTGCLSLKEKAAIKAEQDSAEQQRLIDEILNIAMKRMRSRH